MKLSQILSVVLALGTSAVLLAQTPTPQSPNSAAEVAGAAMNRMSGIVLADLRDNLEKQFASLDKNQDGMIAGDEIEATEQAREDRPRRRERGDARREERRPTMGLGIPSARRLKALDTNADGSVDKSEFLQTVDRFTEWDTDKNGEVDRQELRSGRMARAAQ